MSKRAKANHQALKRPHVQKSPFLEFQNSVRGSQDPRAVVARARHTLLPGLFPDAVKWLRTHPTYGRAVFHPEYPKQWDQLKEARPLPPVSVDRELRWALAYLAPHAKCLRAFIESAAAFEKAFLLSEFDTCAEILDGIENEFGKSLWLLKRRISLLQSSKGLEAQKQYVDVLFHAAPRGIFLSFIAYYVSSRNEPSVTPARFTSQLESIFGQVQALGRQVSSYLQYHIDPHLSVDSQRLQFVLNLESAGTVVDYYDALVSLSQASACLPDGELCSLVLPVASSMYTLIGDARLTPVLALCQTPPAAIPLSRPEVLDGVEEFSRGRYQAAWTAADAILRTDPCDPSALLLAAYASALLDGSSIPGDGDLVHRLVTGLSHVMLRGAAAADDISDLTKCAKNFHGFRGLTQSPPC